MPLRALGTFPRRQRTYDQLAAVALVAMPLRALGTFPQGIREAESLPPISSVAMPLRALGTFPPPGPDSARSAGTICRNALTGSGDFSTKRAVEALKDVLSFVAMPLRALGTFPLYPVARLNSRRVIVAMPLRALGTFPRAVVAVTFRLI